MVASLRLPVFRPFFRQSFRQVAARSGGRALGGSSSLTTSRRAAGGFFFNGCRGRVVHGLQSLFLPVRGHYERPRIFRNAS